MNNLKIQSVKLSNPGTVMVFTEPDGEANDIEVIKKFTSLRHPDFDEAAKAIAPFVKTMMSMIDTADVKVKGISLNFKGDEEEGDDTTEVHISCTYTAPHSGNTKGFSVPAYAYEPSGDPKTFIHSYSNAVKDFLKEAKLFLSGKRAQLSLFGNNEVNENDAYKDEEDQDEDGDNISGKVVQFGSGAIERPSLEDFKEVGEEGIQESEIPLPDKVSKKKAKTA